MATFKSLKELNAYLQKQVQATMQKEVAEVVKDVIQDHVQKDVYDKYDPIEYIRFGHDGGLIDRRNIESRPIEDGIEVENITTHRNLRNTGDKYIPEVIETGVGYDILGGYDYEKPRPFIANSREDLRKSGDHVQALKEGLKKKGFKVE